MVDQPYPSSVPPTEPDYSDEALLADPPAWPKVVGIISIVWASLGLTCGGLFVIMSLFSAQLLKMAEPQMGGPAPSVMVPQWPVLAIGAVGVLWTLTLLAAGIATASRKPVGRTLHLVYAIGSVLLTPISTYLNWKAQMAIAEWAALHPADPWAQNSSPTGNMIGLVVGVALGLGWPLFCLIWFGLVKRTPDSMTGGVQEQAA